MHTRYAHLEDLAIHWVHAGRSALPDVLPDLSRGKAVVFVHGEGGNGLLFRQPLEALVAAGHSPVALDLPLHGRSGNLPAEVRPDVAEYARWLALFLEHLRHRPLVLVGHSLGAAVAVAAAQEQPQLVEALVLCSAPPRFRFEAAYVDTWRQVMLGRIPQPFTLEPFSPKADMKVVRATFMENVKTDPRIRYFDLLAANEFDLADATRRLPQRLRLIAGRDDQLVPLEQAEALSRLLPSAGFDIIDGAGHSLMMEQPEALSEALLRFLGDLG